MERFEGNGKRKTYETISIESRVTILNFPPAYKLTLFLLCFCWFLGVTVVCLFVCFKFQPKKKLKKEETP